MLRSCCADSFHHYKCCMTLSVFCPSPIPVHQSSLLSVSCSVSCSCDIVCCLGRWHQRSCTCTAAALAYPKSLVQSLAYPIFNATRLTQESTCGTCDTSYSTLWYLTMLHGHMPPTPAYDQTCQRLHTPSGKNLLPDAHSFQLPRSSLFYPIYDPFQKHIIPPIQSVYYHKICANG